MTETADRTAKPSRMYVLYSDELGVYLGNCIGLGFWSKMDPAGQDAAPCFSTQADVVAHVHSWDEPLRAEWRIVAVTPDTTLDGTDERAAGPYASIVACVAAGLPAWDPNELPEP